MYHTLADLAPSRISEVQLVQLTNDVPGGATVVQSVWEENAGQADAEIDGYIGARYALPLATTPAIIQRLSIAITLYLLFRRRFEGEDFPASIRKDYEDAVRMLARLSDGTITLGVQPAATPNTERTARLESHTRVFSRSNLESF